MGLKGYSATKPQGGEETSKVSAAGKPPWLQRQQGGMTEDKGAEEMSKARDKGKRKKTSKVHDEDIGDKGEDNW
jgi:hypothetical protein